MMIRTKCSRFLFIAAIVLFSIIVGWSTAENSQYSYAAENNLPDHDSAVVEYEQDGQSYTPETVQSDDPEDLFADYAEGLAKAQTRIIEQKKTAGNKLSGVSKNIYSILKSYISEVAAGDRASTVFEVQVNDLGIEKLTWTAEELGVESIIADDEITEEAAAALRAKGAYDLSAIIRALLADCPYSLYWYDKIVSTEDSGYNITAFFDDEKGEYVIGFDGSISFSFPVAGEFSAGEYTVDTEIGKSANAIADKAGAIVAKYAAASDHAKLDAYREEICSLVSYNHEAANGGAAYGNPWQMIWVFDDDISTNVVCEGYAKAFQYLCNLTEFNGEIECITVTGTMNGGTGAGNHMWNIVTMENGKNYLVDITNCDEGSIGADDQLFLAGYSNKDSDYQYSFDCDMGSVVYCYDETALSLYSESELSLENARYEISGETRVVTKDGIKYEITGDNAVVKGTTDDSADIIIPASIEGAIVTAIDGSAFANSEDIESISLPGTIRAIKSFDQGNEVTGAFYHCKNLKTVRFEENSVLKEIGKFAFSGCKNLDSIELPDSIATIQDEAFSNCEALITLKLPKNLSNVGQCAFSDSGIRSITIPAKLSRSLSIGLEAFRSRYLEEILVEEGDGFLKSLDGVLYYYGTDISTGKIVASLLAYPGGKHDTEYVMPDFVTSTDCIITNEYLETIVIGENCENIYEPAKCSFDTIKVSPKNKFFEESDGLLFSYGAEELIWVSKSKSGKLVVPDGVKSMQLRVAEGNELITEVVLPESMEIISEGAFSGCRALESVVMPEGLKEIGKYAFYDCSQLKNITIPSGMSVIRANAFTQCSLTTVAVPSSIDLIEDDAFDTGVEIIYEGEKSLDEIYPGYIYGDRIDVDDFVIIGDNLISYNGSDEEIEIPNSVKKIRKNAFSHNNTIRKVTIPEGVVSIDFGAFYGCSNLEKINIPSTVRKMDEVVFKECPCLKTVGKGDDYNIMIEWDSEIPDYAFNSSNIETIVVPEGIEKIGDRAFYYCSQLTDVQLPDSMSIVGMEAFTHTPWYESFLSDMTIIGETLIRYRGEEENVVVPEGIRYLADSAFYQNNFIKTVLLPESISIIGDSAFEMCPYLTHVNLPVGIEYIGSRAFANSGIEEVDIPEGIKVIKNSLFDCSDIKKVRLPDGVECIEEYAFNYTPLMEINLPDSLSEIKTGAFRITSLKSVEVPGSVKKIEKEAFYKNMLESVVIGEGVETIEKKAFGECHALEHVVLPESLKNIETSIFTGCPLLREASYLDDGSGMVIGWTDSIPANAFLGDEQLRTVVFPETVKKIGNRAFAQCQSLESVSGLKQLENIGDFAFSGCTSLREFYFPFSIEKIGNYIFRGVDVFPTLTYEGDAYDFEKVETGNHNEWIEELNYVHKYGQWTIVKEPTCTETGERIRTCSECGNVDSEIVAATGHTEEVISGRAATCTEPGLTDGKKCSVCGEILVAQKDIDALGHDWGEWTVVKEATEDEEGIEQRVCSRDDSHIEESAIPKLNHMHNLVKTAAVAASCTEAGNIEYWTCSKCHKIYSDADAENEITEAKTVVDATGHTEEVIPGRAATCTDPGLTDGKRCSVCGEILVAQKDIDALGHDYQELANTAVAATCETAGKEADKKCSRCDSFIEGVATPALGHDWSEWTVVKEATEDEEGIEQRVCSRDDSHVEERAIPKLNHMHNLVWTKAAAASCTEAGNIEYWTCSKCGKLYSDENAENEIDLEATILKETGHDWSDGVMTREPTYEEEGEVTFTCGSCGGIYIEPIPKLDKEQAAAYEEINVAEETANQAQQMAENINENSLEQDIAKADQAAAESVASAQAAELAAEAAVEKAISEYGEGSEAVVFAKAKLTQARKVKVKAMLTSVSVKIVIADTSVQTVDTAVATAAEAAEKPGAAAVSAAQAAETAAREYVEKATAAKETADAAFEAVVAAGYTTDSAEYKEAVKAVTVATEEKTNAETKLTEASAAVVAAKEAKAKAEKEEAKKVIVDLPKVIISKAVGGKKSATVKWKKVSKKNQKKIAKIQIQYSTDKKFKKGVKTTTAKKSAVSKKISKLKKGKRYYFRIRAYKVSGGRVHVSKWSSYRYTKIK